MVEGGFTIVLRFLTMGEGVSSNILRKKNHIETVNQIMIIMLILLIELTNTELNGGWRLLVLS